VRPLDPLLDLRQELIHQPRPHGRLTHRPARIPRGDVRRDRVVGTPHQLGRASQRLGQVIRFQDFHDLLGRLHGVPPRGDGRFSTADRTRGGACTGGTGQADDVVSGRSHDHQRAVLMTANGQSTGRLRAVCRGRRQSPEITKLWKNRSGDRGVRSAPHAGPTGRSGRGRVSSELVAQARPPMAGGLDRSVATR